MYNKIDWEKCSIHIPEGDADKTGAILEDWLSKHSDSEILERGMYGREIWLRWLDSRKWNSLFAEAVENHLIKIGNTTRIVIR